MSEFFHHITDDQRTQFLDAWNHDREHEEKVYISYDSTNRNCQAGEVSFAEHGYAKDDESKPIVNLSIAYDTNNRVPLLYENYPGSIPDVSQLEYLIEKLGGYGYRNIGVIIDRGYFSKKNLQFLDSHKVPFIIMVKGVRDVVEAAIEDVRGTFERNRRCRNKKYRVYGATTKRQLYETDASERNFHIFYSDIRGAKDRENVEEKVDNARKKLEKMIGRKMLFPESNPAEQKDNTAEQSIDVEDVEKKAKQIQKEKEEIEKNARALKRVSNAHYFDLIFDKEGVFAAIIDKDDVITKEKDDCGYFAIISSEDMTAERALALYKGRDPSEKLFCSAKSFLGDHASRVYSDESEEGKTFVQFIALLIRQKLYTCLLDEDLKQPSSLNYMNVPAAIKELEKIEMTQLSDGTYRLNWAITATQKTILSAFKLKESDIKNGAKEIANRLTPSTN